MNPKRTYQEEEPSASLPKRPRDLRHRLQWRVSPKPRCALSTCAWRLHNRLDLCTSLRTGGIACRAGRGTPKAGCRGRGLPLVRWLRVRSRPWSMTGCRCGLTGSVCIHARKACLSRHALIRVSFPAWSISVSLDLTSKNTARPPQTARPSKLHSYAKLIPQLAQHLPDRAHAPLLILHHQQAHQQRPAHGSLLGDHPQGARHVGPERLEAAQGVLN